MNKLGSTMHAHWARELMNMNRFGFTMHAHVRSKKIQRQCEFQILRFIIVWRKGSLKGVGNFLCVSNHDEKHCFKPVCYLEKKKNSEIINKVGTS